MPDGVTFEERHNNTPEQIHEYLQAAEDICAVHGFRPKDDPAVFVKVLELVASKSVMTLQRQSVPIDLGALGLPNGFRG